MSDRPETDALDAHLQKLAAAGLLHVVDRPIDKDREMHPLVAAAATAAATAATASTTSPAALAPPATAAVPSSRAM